MGQFTSLAKNGTLWYSCADLSIKFEAINWPLRSFACQLIVLPVARIVPLNVDAELPIVKPQRNCGPDRRDKATLELHVQGTIVRKLIGNLLCLHEIARKCKSQRRTRGHVHITAQAQRLRDRLEERRVGT